MSQEGACNQLSIKAEGASVSPRTPGKGVHSLFDYSLHNIPPPPQGSEMRAIRLAQGGRRSNEPLRLALAQKPVPN